MRKLRDYFRLLAGVLLMVILMGGNAGGQVWQEWVALYTGPNTLNRAAYAVAVDQWGKVYVTGSNSFDWEPGSDIVTIKYNALGSEQWVATYHGSGNNADVPVDLKLDQSGNLYIVGYSVNAGSGSDILILKYDPWGTLLWAASFNGPLNGADWAFSLALDAAANVYVTGCCSTGLLSSRDFATVKYDSSGILQWSAIYNGPGNGLDEANSIALDDAGNVLVTGRSMGVGTNLDYATIKYDSTGNQLWVARYDGPSGGEDQMCKLALDSGGNVYVTGWSSQATAYPFDWATVKYDPQGLEQWVVRFNSSGTASDMTYGIATDSQDNVIVTGSGAGGWLHTYKYDTIGNAQWAVVCPSGWPDYLALDSQDDIYLTTGGNGNLHTLKYSSSGTLIWQTYWDGPGNDWDIPYDIAVDANFNVYAVGRTDHDPLPESAHYDFFTIKYSQPEISISLTAINPPLQIPPTGGSFDFTVELSNSAQSQQTFDAWIMVQLPGGTWYGPVLGPIALTLPGGGNLTRLRSQNVPGSAPAGTYLYQGYVGDYPSAPWDSSSFTFEKLGSGRVGLGAGNWTNTGEELIGGKIAQNDEIQHSSFSIHHFSVSPNPFNPLTTLTFSLPQAAQVTLAVYDLQGSLVAQLVNGSRPAGVHEVTWDASQQASGMYFCRIQAGDFTAIKKMMLVK